MLFFRSTVIFLSANKHATPHTKATATGKLSFQDPVWDLRVSGGRHDRASAGGSAEEPHGEEFWPGRPRMGTRDRWELMEELAGGTSTNMRSQEPADSRPLNSTFSFLEAVRDQTMPPSPFPSHCL